MVIRVFVRVLVMHGVLVHHGFIYGYVFLVMQSLVILILNFDLSFTPFEQATTTLLLFMNVLFLLESLSLVFDKVWGGLLKLRKVSESVGQ